MTDSEYLSLMYRRIFRAGLKHIMVDTRWPVFEEVFYGFDIERVMSMSDDALEDLMKDRRIIRHWGKIKSVRANTQRFFDLLQSADIFGASRMTGQMKPLQDSGWN